MGALKYFPPGPGLFSLQRCRYPATARKNTLRSNNNEIVVVFVGGRRGHSRRPIALGRLKLPSPVPELSYSLLKLSINNDGRQSRCNLLSCETKKLITRNGRLLKNIAAIACGSRLRTRVCVGTLSACVLCKVNRFHDKIQY